MKCTNTIAAIILLVTIGCGRDKQSVSYENELIIVDVTKSYPKKKLVLQDFMDIEYVPLEANDDFINQGIVLTIGKKFILVRNKINDGNIFIYDRTGKAIRKINRKGQGHEEYLYYNDIVLDENNNEIFINNLTGKILVYDLYGNFKRSVKYSESAEYLNIFNYDKDNLICYDNSVYGKDGEERGSQSYHLIISKQDGLVNREIYIPFQKIKSQMIKLHIDLKESPSTMYSSNHSIIPYQGNWVLVELSSDTLYKYFPDNQLMPFIVRAPSIQTMDTEVFLFLHVITERYYFMKTVKKEFDFTTNRGWPSSNLIYDVKEKKIYEYTISNDDISRPIDLWLSCGENDEIAHWRKIEANFLVETYKKGELKGRLKEIAATLDEDSNPVIMLVKHKK
jgi:hypothetical protein